MHLRFISAAVLLCTLLVSSTAYAANDMFDCTLFTRNLKVGMSGADVKELQRVLNASQIVVSDSGVGSYKNEGTYFGQKTKVALVKFQERYAKDTLAPAGLAKGSGYFGQLTRKKLIEVCTKVAGSSGTTVRVPNPTPRPVTTPTPSTAVVRPVTPTPTPTLPTGALSAFLTRDASKDPLSFSFPSEYVVNPGGPLALFGRGFTASGNVVHIGNLTIGDVAPDQYGVLNIKIPKTAAKGKFELWISNAKGESNRKFLVVKDASTPSPSVTDFTPRSGALGTMVKVTGKGLTSSNDIYVSNHILKGVPSADGTTLTFKMTAEEIPGAVDGFDMPGVSKSLPYWFYIVNENGVSNHGVFTIKI